ncbi:MAG: hypothetical protein IT260_06440, partial [Saprospiraceae bacterium]|nr:hypothetical protein [Saprospiraceae bacterium]
MRALPPASLRSLDKFIASPYHVTHAGVGALYSCLRGLLADPAAVEPDKARLAERLGESPQRLYHLTSYLLEALEEFLALEAWRQRAPERQLGAVEALRRLRLDELSGSMLRYARKRLEAEPYRGGGYYRAEYALHQEAYHLSQQQGRDKTFKLQELSKAQDIALLCEKLRTGCMLLSHQAVFKRQLDQGLLEPVLAFLDGHPYLEIPAVAAYYHGY